MKTFFKNSIGLCFGGCDCHSCIGKTCLYDIVGNSGFFRYGLYAQPHTVFKLELCGELEERSHDDFYKLLWGDDSGVLGLDDVLLAIREAKDNSNIDGIYLKLDGLSAGYGSLAEIRNELARF